MSFLPLSYYIKNLFVLSEYTLQIPFKLAIENQHFSSNRNQVHGYDEWSYLLTPAFKCGLKQGYGSTMDIGYAPSSRLLSGPGEAPFFLDHFIWNPDFTIESKQPKHTSGFSLKSSARGIGSLRVPLKPLPRFSGFSVADMVYGQHDVEYNLHKINLHKISNGVMGVRIASKYHAYDVFGSITPFDPDLCVEILVPMDPITKRVSERTFATVFGQPTYQASAALQDSYNRHYPGMSKLPESLYAGIARHTPDHSTSLSFGFQSRPMLSVIQPLLPNNLLPFFSFSAPAPTAFKSQTRSYSTRAQNPRKFSTTLDTGKNSIIPQRKEFSDRQRDMLFHTLEGAQDNVPTVETFLEAIISNNLWQCLFTSEAWEYIQKGQMFKESSQEDLQNGINLLKSSLGNIKSPNYEFVLSNYDLYLYLKGEGHHNWRFYRREFPHYHLSILDQIIGFRLINHFMYYICSELKSHGKFNNFCSCGIFAIKEYYSIIDNICQKLEADMVFTKVYEPYDLHSLQNYSDSDISKILEARIPILYHEPVAEATALESQDDQREDLDNQHDDEDLGNTEPADFEEPANSEEKGAGTTAVAGALAMEESLLELEKEKLEVLTAAVSSGVLANENDDLPPVSPEVLASQPAGVEELPPVSPEVLASQPAGVEELLKAEEAPMKIAREEEERGEIEALEAYKRYITMLGGTEPLKLKSGAQVTNARAVVAATAKNKSSDAEINRQFMRHTYSFIELNHTTVGQGNLQLYFGMSEYAGLAFVDTFNNACRCLATQGTPVGGLGIVNLVSTTRERGAGGFIHHLIPGFRSSHPFSLENLKDFYYRKLCWYNHFQVASDQLEKDSTDSTVAWTSVMDNIISIDFAAIYFYPIRTLLEKMRLLRPMESNHRLKEATIYNNQSFNISFGHRCNKLEHLGKTYEYEHSFIVQITDIQYQNIISNFLDYFNLSKRFAISPGWLKFFKIIIE
jgi:hypothetical protein